jgi:hypothetical protein
MSRAESVPEFDDEDDEDEDEDEQEGGDIGGLAGDTNTDAAQEAPRATGLT